MMRRLHSNRILAGNIAFLLFLAFFAVIAVGPAQAAPTFVNDASITPASTAGPGAWVKLGSNLNWTAVGQEATAQYSQDLAGTKSVNVTVQVVTPIASGWNWLGSVKLNGTDITDRISTVYQSTYASVYSVYQFVYNWVYQFSDTANTNTTLGVYVYNPTLTAVSFDLEVQPPRSSSGGGGGGGAAATTPTASSDVGSKLSGNTFQAAAKAELSGTKATITIDSASITSQLSNSAVKEIVLAAPADVAGKAFTEAAIQIDADTLSKIFAADKPVVVKVAGADLAIPVGALDLSKLTGQGINVVVNVAKVTSGAAVSAAVGAFKVAGDVYSIEINAVAAGVDKGAIKLAKPVTLALKFDAAKVADTSYLGIYRWGTSTWDYMGGAVNKTTGTVSVLRESLSTYAVMSYEKDFADMNGHWAAGDVKLMVAKHVVNGITDTSFVPNTNVSRAQFAAMLVRALGLAQTDATGAKFADVAAGAWYGSAVETAAANGLVNGYSDGTFKPNAPITRQELAAMVSRSLTKGGVTVTVTADEAKAELNKFSDASTVGNWAVEPLAVAVKKGIVNGRTATLCAPEANATRAEAAVMVKRFLGACDKL